MFAERLRWWWKPAADRHLASTTRRVPAVERTDSRELAYDDEFKRLTVVLLDLGLRWAPVDRNTRALARVLLAAAEETRTAALKRTSQTATALPEWSCMTCGESNPPNFDLCWNCECDRASPP